MTDRAELADRVMTIVAEKVERPRDQITLETSFQQDLNADSLDMVELLMNLEETFGIEIDDEEAETIKTISNAVDFIEKKMESKAD